MKSLIICILLLVFPASVPRIIAGPQESGQTGSPALKLSVVFNNEPYNQELKTDWGFACVIEGLERTILFDTGNNGGILLSNMKIMGIGSKDIDMVILSHFHGDHTNGMADFLKQNANVTVYMPESFPDSFQERVKSLGAKVELVDGPLKIFKGVHSTGEMGTSIIEQSLILDTSQGLVIVNGCSHPGIVDIVKKAKKIRGKEIYFVLGGFHLGQTPEAEIREIIREFKELGVKKVGATHCTGDQAIAMFRKAWGDNYVDCGCGAVIGLDR
ncbi:MAG TPA: MBL fold metallo-hydrolase [archaeon]|nr:MBL fold metallo-hydrolase [archaeon]